MWKPRRLTTPWASTASNREPSINAKLQSHTSEYSGSHNHRQGNIKPCSSRTSSIDLTLISLIDFVPKLITDIRCTSYCNGVDVGIRCHEQLHAKVFHYFPSETRDSNGNNFQRISYDMRTFIPLNTNV
jgi:hypothetical protein